MIPGTLEREEPPAHFGQRKALKSSKIGICLAIMVGLTCLAAYAPDLGELPYGFLIFAVFMDLLLIALILNDFKNMFSANRFRFSPAGFAPPALPFPYSKQDHGFVDFRAIEKIMIFISSKKYTLSLQRGTISYRVSAESIGEVLFNDFLDYLFSRIDMNGKFTVRFREGNKLREAPIADKMALGLYRDRSVDY